MPDPAARLRPSPAGPSVPSPPLSLGEIVALIGGRLVGEADLEIRGVAPLTDAGA